MRASSKSHVEYEVLKYLMDRIDLTELEEKMCPSGDKTAEKRFVDGADSVSVLINNMIIRRLHRLPKTHPAYRGKEE
mgnify:CR=1 FL=1|tara:strand:- start:1328 stop:1558 length:231 start_codon:yes stop_codon:yes gene_type:complete